MTVTLLSKAPDFTTLKTRHVQKDSALLISPPLDNHKGPMFGDIIVCEDQLYFYSESSTLGIAVPYPNIVIHAASRQEGQPNIYYGHDVTELRFIPRDSGAVEGIYMTMSDCAELYPDNAIENEQEFSADPSDDTELNELQQAAFKHLETVFEPKQQ
ncbi:unnamed protein product [Rhizopus stolonifer]